MDLQLLIVLVLVAASAFYIGRSIWRSARGNSCETGACKCDSKDLKKV